MSPNKMIPGYPQRCVNSQLCVIDASEIARHNVFDAGVCLRVLPGNSDHLQVVPSMLEERGNSRQVNAVRQRKIGLSDWNQQHISTMKEGQCRCAHNLSRVVV